MSIDVDTADTPIVYTRADWTEFRDPSRLTARAGCKADQLPKVVIKELVDNAYDAAGPGGEVGFGLVDVTPEAVTVYVENDGGGMPGDDAEIAERFSIRRPLTSSKTIRKPARGMLGNGLRVVAGTVLVCGGTIRVGTRDRMVTLCPQRDGTTIVVGTEPWAGEGTRIEVTFRGTMREHADPDSDSDLFGYANEARELTRGDSYKGKSSFAWYDDDAFREMLEAAGPVPIERLIGREMDGASGREACKGIVGDLWGRSCGSLTAAEVKGVRSRGLAATSLVTADRLGKVGRRDDYAGYGEAKGCFRWNGAELPFVIEAWANRADDPGIAVSLNRTPIVSQVSAFRSGQEKLYYHIHGAGLNHLVKVGAERAGDCSIALNVIVPCVPLTSSGKDPDLRLMVPLIREAVEKAVRTCKRKCPAGEGQKAVSQKSVIIDRLAAGVAELSGGGLLVFSLRQLFYFVRPALIAAIGREPSYGTFSEVIGNYEDEHGDIEGLYRDDRGTLYTPHSGGGPGMPLGTRSVADYTRPEWTFNKVLYCEKEGPFPNLKSSRWPERHDCALLSSKGYATRAVREVLKRIKGTGEPVEIYCVHDADGPGTRIYQSLKEGLAADGVEVIDLGLNPAEGRAMGLQVEPVNRQGDSRVPVNVDLPAADQEWLQENRIELNAIKPPQFLVWLDRKMDERGGKVVPPAAVVAAQVKADAREEAERLIREEVLRKADIPARVNRHLRAKKAAIKAAARVAARTLHRRLETNPDTHWTSVVKDAAKAAVA